MESRDTIRRELNSALVGQAPKQEQVMIQNRHRLWCTLLPRRACTRATARAHRHSLEAQPVHNGDKLLLCLWGHAVWTGATDVSATRCVPGTGREDMHASMSACKYASMRAGGGTFVSRGFSRRSSSTVLCMRPCRHGDTIAHVSSGHVPAEGCTFCPRGDDSGTDTLEQCRCKAEASGVCD